MSLSEKRWNKPLPAPVEKVSALAKELDILPALGRVLLHRGIEPAAARDFLHPSLEQLHSPWLMMGMERAVERIGAALQKGEKIVVHGDYDVDGITAAALLVETLRQLGAAAVDFYLPSRFREGYGLHREALEQIAAAGARLVITVDCGANAFDEALCARELGLDLIVTDHHRPFGEIEAAAAVLNPLQEGCRYPFKELSGAGIAFKLAAALMERAGADFPREQLDLAALGTAADMVPLRGENRVLTACGLAQLRRSPRPGLRALAAAGGMEPEQLNGYGLAFVLAPPLNAAGRMGDADPAIRLLLEREEEKAKEKAQLLDRLNRQRRDKGAQILKEAEEMLAADRRGAGEHIITLAGGGWLQGVVGIVASRLVERFNRPVVLISLEGDEGRGSARSIPGFDITAALHNSAALLERFGGHKQAAGLTVKAGRVDQLRDELNRYAAEKLRPEHLSPLLQFDALLEPPEIGMELARQVALLEPFGVGNPRPLFCGRGWELSSWRLVGADQKHLKLNLAAGEHRADPIFFSAAALEPSLGRGRRFDLAFTLGEGRYGGRPVLDMVLKDLRRGDIFTCGRVTVIDRRGLRRRLSTLKKILDAESAPAVIFVGTKGRKEVLRRQLPPGLPLAFLTSGRDNYEQGLPAAPEEMERALILYDLPLSRRTLESFFESCPGEGPIRVYLLYREADRERNELLINLALPSKSALEEIYQAWDAAAAGSAGGDLPDQVKQKISPQAGKKFWERCLKIYDESGLRCSGAELAQEEPLSLEPFLESSSTFEAVQQLREDCFEHQEKLLQAPPEELAAAWSELTGSRDCAE